MSALVNEISDWATSLLLAAAMLAGWAAGWWRGRAAGKPENGGAAVKFSDAIMALLGLLLAFTFSMSLVKHDQRRQMMINDSNAIGDFYTCASLLDEEQRGELQAVLRQYVEHRLALARTAQDEATFQRMLDEVPPMHARMQELVAEAVNAGTPLVVPLVNTLNALTSSHAARLVAVRDRLPSSIVLLLTLAAVLTMVLAGYQQGAQRQWRLGAACGFTVLVSMVVWVTLDLNQPQSGLITVSQEPLERLFESMDGNTQGGASLSQP